MCTGQKPNTEMIAEISPECIVPDGPSRGLAVVNRHMQLSRILPRKAVDATADVQLEKTLASLSVGDAPQEVLAGDAEDPFKDDPEFEVANPNIFVVGDSADAFGAIKAGHTAYWQVCPNIHDPKCCTDRSFLRARSQCGTFYDL